MNLQELYLKVFLNRSEFVNADGTKEIFNEGKQSDDSNARYRLIQKSLRDGYLSEEIEYCKKNQHTLQFEQIPGDYVKLLDTLIDSLTSEVGRALIAVTLLQLCIKSIAPEQNIRLHKAGKSSRDFSWQDGISMRSLDNTYFTPVLRKYNLLSLNADGFMMTRSLAENYPYTLVYKANMRGARYEWLQIVEGIERNALDSRTALRYLLVKLLNQADRLKAIAAQTLLALDNFVTSNTNISFNGIRDLIFQHIERSTYAARAMEIAMHSLLTTLGELNTLGDMQIEPLSQMRSANKKHGNIGDIELMHDKKIVEAWDAKFGITYLRDEIEEIVEKLKEHDAIQLIGFVTSEEPIRMEELKVRIDEISDLTGVDVKIITLVDWCKLQAERAERNGISLQLLGQEWLRMYVMYFANQKRDFAPIDEPTYQWLEELYNIISVM